MASEMEKVALLVVLLLQQIRRGRKVGCTQTWARKRIGKSRQQGAYPNGNGNGIYILHFLYVYNQMRFTFNHPTHES